MHTSTWLSEEILTARASKVDLILFLTQPVAFLFYKSVNGLHLEITRLAVMLDSFLFSNSRTNPFHIQFLSIFIIIIIMLEKVAAISMEALLPLSFSAL